MPETVAPVRTSLGRFSKLLDDTVERERDLLVHKRAEYATDADPLRNFHIVADFLGTTPERVCVQYLVKHVQSIVESTKRSNMGDDGLVWETEDGHEGLWQRISDARNYLILLAALIAEQKLKIDAVQ